MCIVFKLFSRLKKLHSQLKYPALKNKEINFLISETRIYLYTETFNIILGFIYDKKKCAIFLQKPLNPMCFL